MKKSISKKLVLSICALCIAFLLCFGGVYTSFAYAEGGYYENGVYVRTLEEQQEFDALRAHFERESELADVFKAKEKKKLTKEQADEIKKYMNATKDSVDEVVSMVKIFQNVGAGKDFDTAKFINTLCSLASNIANCCPPPWGAIVGSAISLGNTVFNAIMGGEEGTSEIAKMEDRINQQFDDLNRQLNDLESQIADLSNQINDSTNKIINAIPSALDDADAKQYLRTFMLSGEGNFSYKTYRNYLYGEASNNAQASTAYYAQLKKAQERGDESAIDYYYKKLYISLMKDKDLLYHYVLADDESNLIIRKYYNVVSKNKERAKPYSPETATIMFADELYQTVLYSDIILMSCTEYFYEQMLLNGTTELEISTNEKIYLSQVDGKNDDDIVDELLFGADEIHDQIASDLAYIIGLTNSYILEDNNKLYYVGKGEDATFGNVKIGQKVYLNQMYSSLCNSSFDLDEKDFIYVSDSSNVIINDNGKVSFTKDGSYTIELYYKGMQRDVEQWYSIGSITFNVGNNSEFNGGDGSVENPYLISNASQFNNIKKGLDKHYKLIKDINFNDATIYPIGYNKDNDSYKAFTGSLDGNGFSLENLNITLGQSIKTGECYCGLFSKVGSDGEITNLKLHNVNVSTDIAESTKTVSNYYVGLLAGENNGLIKYITVTAKKDNTYIDFELDNKTHNRNISVYCGGIVGANNNIVSACIVSNIKIDVQSTHDFGGDSTSSNKHFVYTGGISGENNGEIGYSVIKDGVIINTYAKSTYNPKTTVNPYLLSLAGGICGSLKNGILKNVNSQIINISNEADLDCKSGWGAHYNNYSCKTDNILPSLSESEKADVCLSENEILSAINSTKLDNEITLQYDSISFTADTKTFSANGLKLLENGKEVKDFKILNVYGFNGQNKEFGEISDTVTVLFCVTLQNNQSILIKKDVEYKMLANEMVDFNISYLKTQYYTGDEISFEGVTIEKINLVGSETLNANSLNIKYNNFDTSTPNDSTNKDDIKEFIITIGDISKTIEYNVICRHNLDPVTYLTKGDPVSATCCEMGYTVYHCSLCGQDVYRDYTPIDEHNHNIVKENEESATCYHEGYSSKIWCDRCEEVFEESYTIPRLSHHFGESDDTYHYCDNDGCIHQEAHQYQVVETVEYREIAGQWKYVLVYHYTCIGNGCHDSFEKVDYNANVEENNTLPTVIVSNAYALNGGDEVVVYVQLINNKDGVRAANFGIRYDDELTLISYDDGSLLEGSCVKDSNPVNKGYNFVWADATERYGDGNLLKLTFKMPYKYLENKSYKISVVYGLTEKIDGNTLNNDKSQGGFVGTDNKKHLYITKDGFITFVNHLPGDVNSDNVVDILDAIEIGKHCVKKVVVEKKYGDVNLDNNVDIVDLVIVLQSLTGGYGTNLQSQTFNLALNLNGALLEELGLKEEDLNLLISYYNENGNVNNFDLPSLERAGYKFDGWTRKIYDKNVEHVIKDGDALSYDKDQKSQTLYAQWTLNHIEFVATDDVTNIEDISNDSYYYNKNYVQEINNYFKQEYKLHYKDGNTIYKNDVPNNSTLEDILFYKIIAWEGDDGNYYTLDSNVSIWVDNNGISHNLKQIDLSLPQLGNLKLMPIWDDGAFKNGLSLTGLKTNGYIKGIENVNWYRPKNNDATQYEINSIYQLLNNDGTLTLNDLKAYVKRYATVKNYDNSNRNVKIDGYRDVNLYIGFTPITYTIEYDGNGATSGSMLDETSHTIVKKITIAKNTFVRTGYTFVGWEDEFGNTYDDGQEIGYINGIKDGDIVTLKAIWTAKEYIVTYKLNIPENVKSSNSTLENNIYTYTYDQPFTLEDKITVDGLIFKGWSVKNNNAGESYCFDALSKLNNNELFDYVVNNEITLYAIWDIDPYTVGQYVTKNNVKVSNSQKSITYQVYNTEFPRYLGSNVVIDIRKISDSKLTDGNAIISDFCGDNVYIIGNTEYTYSGSYLCFANLADGITRTLHLKDFKFSSSVSCGTVCNYSVDKTNFGLCEGGNVVFDIHGDCVITSTNNTGTSAAINLANQNITIKGSGNLTVTGGNGANATTNGASGKNGGMGIVATNLTVDMTGSLAVCGGNGGDGADGVGGTDGQDGALGSYGGSNGEDGRDGIDGGDGGKGGNSGIAIYCLNFDIKNGAVNLYSGKSGSGGNGGEGGKGGNGGDAQRISYVGFDPPYPGNGGNGGDGGKGGNGGNSGDVLVPLNCEIMQGNYQQFLGVVGAFGTHGHGGDPGHGGLRGVRTGLFNSENAWGAYGNDGKKGDDGQDGQDGQMLTKIIYKNSNGTFVEFNTENYESLLSGEVKGQIEVYDNSSSGNIKHEVIENDSSSPIKGPIIKITTTGKCSPMLGGYCCQVLSSQNDVYYHVFVAKIPKGYTVWEHLNSIGAGGRIDYLTSREGTGDWEVYIIKVTCGSSGSFRTFGFIALDGPEPTDSNPLVWEVAYNNVFKGPAI